MLLLIHILYWFTVDQQHTSPDQVTCQRAAAYPPSTLTQIIFTCGGPLEVWSCVWWDVSSEFPFSLILFISLVSCLFQRWRWSSGLRRFPVTWRRGIKPQLRHLKVGDKSVCVRVLCCVPTNPKLKTRHFKTLPRACVRSFVHGICAFDWLR